MKRTYIKQRIWHLGSRNIQKGGFLPILGTLAKPLLVSAASAIGGKVLKGIRQKIFWGKKRRHKRKTKRYRYA